YIVSTLSTQHTCFSLLSHCLRIFSLFFYNAPSPTEIYTLSLHDALPIWRPKRESANVFARRKNPTPCRRLIFHRYRGPARFGHRESARGDAESGPRTVAIGICACSFYSGHD